MWFDQLTADWMGALLGSSLGIIGVALGVLTSIHAPKGRHRSLIINTIKALIALAVPILITGIAALAMAQPYHVYYPFLLTGGLMLLIMPYFYRLVKTTYTRIELEKSSRDVMN